MRRRVSLETTQRRRIDYSRRDPLYEFIRDVCDWILTDSGGRWGRGRGRVEYGLLGEIQGMIDGV